MRIPLRSLGLCFAAFLAALPALAADAGALARTQTARLASSVFTDLDGDRRTDFATAGISRRDGYGYVQEIRLGFSSFADDTVTVRTRVAAERMTARDLDGDADRDLVLEALNREPIAVLLNDGGGHFHQADLADFSFQLAHRSPRGIQSAEWESPAADSDECSNDEPVAVRPPASRPVLDGARLTVLLQISPTLWRRARATSRGPPLA